MTKEGTNKRGQQMTLGTIITIVLGITVLVFLIYGFSTGWGNLWQRITGLGGGEVNVDTIKTSCTLACQRADTYGWCTQERNVVIAEGYSGTYNCDQLNVQQDYKKGDETKQVNIQVGTCAQVTCATA